MSKLGNVSTASDGTVSALDDVLQVTVCAIELQTWAYTHKASVCELLSPPAWFGAANGAALAYLELLAS